MRIGYITYGLDRSPTGIGRYTVDLLRAMQSASGNASFILMTTEREDHQRLWPHFERRPLGFSGLLPSLLTVGNLQLLLRTRHYRVDLLHDPNGLAPFFGPFGNIARVATVFDAFAYTCPETHNLVDNWRYRWHLPYAAKLADAIITISVASARDLTRCLHVAQDRVEVIYPGVDRRFAPVTHNSEVSRILQRYGIVAPYLLYVGGINARKNIARLYEAYAAVKRSHPSVTLVIAGKRQWQTREIDETFERLGLEGRVLFTGYVADEDLPVLYSAADVFVFPSLFEGFGLPPLEAMACGTPVVTSNVSSLPEAVGDAALTVDPGDVRAIADAISQVLANPSLAAELRSKGLARAKRFTWERAAQETLAVYEKALARRRRRHK